MKGLLLIISLTAAVSFGQHFDFDSKTFKERDIFRTYRVTFEPNKSNINKESYRFLDSMVHFIMRNEELIIEIAYHREFFGEAYGKCLSCDRAEAISNYLI